MFKIVIRLLDPFGKMLGWAEAQAHARGDGRLWIEDRVLVAVTEDGVWGHTSAHWADVNVEVRMVGTGDTLKKGTIVPLDAPWPVITIGKAAGGLPPVTVGHNVSITVPTGSLGVVGNRA